MRISPNEIKYEVVVRHDDPNIIEWVKGRDLYRAFSHVVTPAILEEQTNSVLACSRPSVGGARVEREGSGKGGRPDPPLPLSRLFFARRCFRSLPPIESLEQANPVLFLTASFVYFNKQLWPRGHVSKDALCLGDELLYRRITL